MKLYILSVGDYSKLKRITKLLEKHNIQYSSMIIILTSEEKARVLGGIISQYKVEKLSLDDILVYILSNSQ